MSDIEKANLEDSSPVGAHPPPAHPSPHLRVLANPSPLGLFSFASTTFVLSMYNLHARSITVPNVVVGMSIFAGGLTQFAAGMWEFAVGNTLGATAFSCYGAFWLSYATILIPGSGIGAALATIPASEAQSAIGIFLSAWVIVTALFFFVCLRTHVGFIMLFGFLDLTFILLAAGQFNNSVMVTKAGGGFGLFTAGVAFWVGTAGLLDAGTSFFTLPIGKIKRN